MILPTSNNILRHYLLVSCQESQTSYQEGTQERQLHLTRLTQTEQSWTRNLRPTSLSPIEVPPGIDWSSRKAMFLFFQWMTHLNSPYNQVFSLSVEPCDPSIHQPVYYKTNCVKHTYLEEDTSAAIFDTKQVSSLSFLNPSEGKSEKEIRPSPGFLKPFETFYSNQLAPEITSKRPPKRVKLRNLSEEKAIEGATKGIQPPPLKLYIDHIVHQFWRDAHSKSLYLITLNPGQKIKRTLFVKKL